jgi:CheY-like chemotaxis protein
VTSVSRLREAVSALDEAAESGDPFRLSVVDLEMHEMDGLRMIRTLRTSRPELWDQMAVVMLTPVDYNDMTTLKLNCVQVRLPR